jgi:hypothetical protein
MTVQTSIREMHKYRRHCRGGTNYTNCFHMSCVKVAHSCTVSEPHYPNVSSTRYYALSVHFALGSVFDYRLPFDTGESEGAHNVGHAHFDPICMLRNAKITDNAKSIALSTFLHWTKFAAFWIKSPFEKVHTIKPSGKLFTVDFVIFSKQIFRYYIPLLHSKFLPRS